ncbi:MAG TPA: HlyD family efflux transporter periplasmic adaptor subunit [Limnohabitans sp.]|uniref:HlyD family efflux transporter periplasmic adaptor subunit n=1 Tax=Limnohabitans sp. TaxID=1907725 RepID=UPI0026C42B34|nr:HlyD family efflux transporter periplasmic adaptor subunit [Limnohabitans sp.]HQR86863.1 HlyD family efflux transporter periplasmic adaptor subunit [Limnohabitans sp.]HQS27040.1 HlyD family efflux transporter periplasmic adaptor subunit [Limnohabitans sp.]
MSNKWIKMGRGLLTPVKRKADITDVSAVNDFDAHADTNAPIRLGFRVLVLGFGGFLLWSALAPLDEGVSSPASVSIETRRKTIQHLSGGVVHSVAVKEGQWVREGEILMELDAGVSKANFEAVRQNYMAQRATESRLLAELKGASQIEFHPDLLKSRNDPLVQQHMQTQQQLFNSRRAAYRAQVSGMASMIESRMAQAAFQAQQVQSIRELAAEGYASRNQLLQLEQSQAELRTSTTDLQTNYARVQQEYIKELSAQLAEVRREVQSGQEKLQAVTDELSRTQLRSPVEGQVVGMTVTSTGGVVTPGQRLMDIVPKGEALLVDAKIPPHVIDKVHTGATVDVRFSSFSNSPQLVLEGRLASLSSDVISEQTSMGVMSYYLGRVEITPEGLKELGSRVMQPGMPAEVLIKTGERSLLTYLMHPLTKRLASSMKEE